MIETNKARENLVRLGIIGAGFLTVTLALVLMQPSPSEVADTPEQADPAPATLPNEVVARADTGLLASPETLDQQPDDMTANVLASLAAPAPLPFEGTEVSKTVEAPADDPLKGLTANVLASLTNASASSARKPSTMQDLVSQALREGQSDAYIDALLNEAASEGAIEVPSALRTEGGRVDTSTLLAELVRKSDPAAAPELAAPIAGGEGDEVRVVQRAGETRQYNFYTVQTGDSLGAIAHRFYGDAALYTAIWDANRQIVSSPDRIRAGQRLSIPSLSSG